MTNPQRIWQQPDWPRFNWKTAQVNPLLRQVRLAQGILLGKSAALEAGPAHPTPKRSDGLTKMRLDALSHLDTPLTLERLLQWHHWLFQSASSSLDHIQIGQLRGDEPIEAPPRALLNQALTDFITWFNDSAIDAKLDPLLRAAMSHFWFATLHPFKEGNKRIARTLADLALAQDHPENIHLPPLLDDDTVLALSQCHTTDLTAWLVWFLQTHEASLQSAIDKLDKALVKARFWQRHQQDELSSEQVYVLNRLLDGNEQDINASLYQTVGNVSKATATRHLSDLLTKACIKKLPGGGRNTRYQIFLG
ncbi:MAG: DUF4172 domain-containing protein [Gammaproteobacteria bacterium]|nr:DUF4172 domain-containing protein [Gammaproteobacteria bacterium]